MTAGLEQLKALFDEGAVGIGALLGMTIHVGGRVATTEGRITDDQDRLVAHGTSTCMVFRPA